MRGIAAMSRKLAMAENGRPDPLWTLGDLAALLRLTPDAARKLVSRDEKLRACVVRVGHLRAAVR